MRYSYQMNADEVIREIKEVREHWDSLNCRLNEVCDNRLIEQLIYEMIADERRYNYLLAIAKELNVHDNGIIIR